MKIEIDQDKCVGAGQCVFAAMDVFDQRDSDGIAVLLTDEPTEEHWEGVREAAAVCPAAAITLHEN
ncbi:ferredoxin [Streptomyces mexicanus]|jgi:ferredoxin|uniref:Ferredoxin n=1 Tax=Streptomyces mexicanus TaxID=178566 RepID=A0A7X1HY30_9ACTN|nr:ferredoxin [Streptomyces mexicanus]MBC2865041.1 ferredoxin [Streptomyces mexicanus]